VQESVNIVWFNIIVVII